MQKKQTEARAAPNHESTTHLIIAKSLSFELNLVWVLVGFFASYHLLLL